MNSQEVIDILTSNIDTLWVIDCAILVFIMQAGFMCMETGLSRHKNSINVALKNAADFGVSVVIFWVFGFGLMTLRIVQIYYRWWFHGISILEGTSKEDTPHA